MFDNGIRYATRRITEVLDTGTQNLLWLLVDSMDAESNDHLQVFALSVCDGIQKIIHTQEQPPYKKESVCNGLSPITETVYIIDDGTHQTMLLADEYRREEK